MSWVLLRWLRVPVTPERVMTGRLISGSERSRTLAVWWVRLVMMPKRILLLTSGRPGLRAAESPWSIYA